MLVLMQALRARGHRVDLICPEPPPGANRSLWQEAKRRGIEPIRAVERLRGALRPGDRARVRRLRRWLEPQDPGPPYEIVHCWHSRDHVLAARALGLLGPGVRRDRPERARLVRTLSRSGRIPRWPWNRRLFGRACDGLICADEATRRENRDLRAGRPFEATLGAIDLDALETHRAPAEVRSELGLSEDAFLIGVVARMQAHRRFDLLLEALASIVRERPEVRLVLIGRGTRVEEVVARPARAMGLEIVGRLRRLSDRRLCGRGRCDGLLHLPRARIGRNVSGAAPGSGPRTAAGRHAPGGDPRDHRRRGERLAGLRNAGGDRGRLVEPEGRPERRHAMGAVARERARARFDPARHAEWMEGFYETLRAE